MDRLYNGNENDKNRERTTQVESEKGEIIKGEQNKRRRRGFKCGS